MRIVDTFFCQLSSSCEVEEFYYLVRHKHFLGIMYAIAKLTLHICRPWGRRQRAEKASFIRCVIERSCIGARLPSVWQSRRESDAASPWRCSSYRKLTLAESAGDEWTMVGKQWDGVTVGRGRSMPVRGFLARAMHGSYERQRAKTYIIVLLSGPQKCNCAMRPFLMFYLLPSGIFPGTISWFVSRAHQWTQHFLQNLHHLDSWL